MPSLQKPPFPPLFLLVPSFLHLLSRPSFPSPSKPECTGKDWGLVVLPFLSSLHLLLHWVKPIPCSFFTWTTHRSRSHGQKSQGIALVWGVTRRQTARTLEKEFSQSSGCLQQPPRRRHTEVGLGREGWRPQLGELVQTRSIGDRGWEAGENMGGEGPVSHGRGLRESSYFYLLLPRSLVWLRVWKQPGLSRGERRSLAGKLFSACRSLQLQGPLAEPEARGGWLL